MRITTGGWNCDDVAPAKQTWLKLQIQKSGDRTEQEEDLRTGTKDEGRKIEEEVEDY